MMKIWRKSLLGLCIEFTASLVIPTSCPIPFNPLGSRSSKRSFIKSCKFKCITLKDGKKRHQEGGGVQ